MTDPVGSDRHGTQRLALSRHALTYTVSAVVLQALSFVSTPFVARSAGIGGYGILEVLGTTLALLVVVVSGGVDAAAVRLFAQQDDPAARRDMVTSGLLLIGVTSAIAGAAVAITANGLAAHAHLAALTIGIAWFGASVPAALVMAYLREILRLLGRPSQYILVAGMTTLVSTVTILALLYWGAGSVAAVYSGTALGYLAGALTAAAQLGWRAFGRARAVWAVQLLRHGAPLAGANIASWSLLYIDRYALATAAPLAAVGTYGLANRLSSVLYLIISAVLTAWTPIAMRIAEDGDTESRLRAELIHFLAIGTMVGGATITALTPEAMLVIAGTVPDDSVRIVWLLCTAMIPWGFIGPAQALFLVRGRSVDMVRATLVAAGINAVICFPLALWLGAQGAALATLVGYTVLAVLSHNRSQALSPVHLTAGRLVLVFALCLPVAALGFWAQGPVIERVVTKLVVGGLLTAFGAYTVVRSTHDLGVRVSLGVSS